MEGIFSSRKLFKIGIFVYFKCIMYLSQIEFIYRLPYCVLLNLNFSQNILWQLIFMFLLFWNMTTCRFPPLDNIFGLNEYHKTTPLKNLV